MTHKKTQEQTSLSSLPTPDATSRMAASNFLAGQILIAMPNMEDTRFAQSLVLICNHNDEGAMGLIINKTYPELSFLEVTSQLGLLTDTLKHDLPHKTLFYGGPVDPGRGFVLHSPEFYHKNYTQILSKELSLTASIDIIDSIAHQKGPKHALIMLGYAGWTAGQLDSEVLSNGWLHCPMTLDLLFHTPISEKYDRALKSIGISKDFLSMNAGHA